MSNVIAKENVGNLIAKISWPIWVVCLSHDTINKLRLLNPALKKNSQIALKISNRLVPRFPPDLLLSLTLSTVGETATVTATIPTPREEEEEGGEGRTVVWSPQREGARGRGREREEGGSTWTIYLSRFHR